MGYLQTNLPDLADLFQRRVADRHFVVAIEKFVERAELLMKGDPIDRHPFADGLSAVVCAHRFALGLRLHAQVD